MNNTPEQALSRLNLAMIYLEKVRGLGDSKKLRFGINVVKHSINWLENSINETANLETEENFDFYQEALIARNEARQKMESARQELLGKFKLVKGNKE